MASTSDDVKMDPEEEAPRRGKGSAIPKLIELDLAQWPAFASPDGPLAGSTLGIGKMLVTRAGREPTYQPFAVVPPKSELADTTTMCRTCGEFPVWSGGLSCCIMCRETSGGVHGQSCTCHVGNGNARWDGIPSHLRRALDSARNRRVVTGSPHAKIVFVTKDPPDTVEDVTDSLAALRIDTDDDGFVAV